MDFGRYRLVMRQGPIPGKVYELEKDVLTIGRDVSNDVVVNDAEVSRTHARLTAQADGYMVEDLASTNGVFINGQRITTPRLVRPGDMLGLSETVVMRLELVSEAAATIITPAVDGDAAPSEYPDFSIPYEAVVGSAKPSAPGFGPTPNEPKAEAPKPFARPASKPAAPVQPVSVAPTGNTAPNSTAVIAAMGCGVVALCLCVTLVAVFLYIDANNLYCQIAPGIFSGCR